MLQGNGNLLYTDQEQNSTSRNSQAFKLRLLILKSAAFPRPSLTSGSLLIVSERRQFWSVADFNHRHLGDGSNPQIKQCVYVPLICLGFRKVAAMLKHHVKTSLTKSEAPEPECSSQYSQKPASGPKPEPTESTPHSPNQSPQDPSNPPTYASAFYVVSFFRVISSNPCTLSSPLPYAKFILLDVICLMIFGVSIYYEAPHYVTFCILQLLNPS
jgi:hypothetical protein